MKPVVYTWLRLVGVSLALHQAVLAQQCYYPNGSPAAGSEKPCSSAEGSACCPEKWQCLDNGLCYYPPDKLYGRYSCTDKSWKSPGCASNMCTYGMTASGGESITQCSNHDNQWCCNADAVHVNCCQESPSPRPFFALQDGQAYATIGASTADSNPDIATITGQATSGGSGGGGGSSASATAALSAPSSGSPFSNTPQGSSSNNGGAGAGTPTAAATPVTSLRTDVSSGSAGIATVVQTIVTTPPVAASTSDPATATSTSKSSHSNIGLIVGCAVGIPLGLALIGILIWLFRKRSHQKKHPYSETPDPYTNGDASPEFAGGAKLHKPANGGLTKYRSESEPGVPELGGQGIGPERPISTIKGRAELDSGAGFAPGTTPHAPHLVGLGGGNGTGHTPQSSWGSAPPGYSPGMNQQAWAPQDGGHVPYRPPQGHETTAGGARMSNMPEMAELSSVRTPPEVAELASGRTPPAA